MRTLRRLPIIVLQQPAQPRLAANRRCAYRRFGGVLLAPFLPHRHVIFDALVRPFTVVVFDDLLDEIVQMPLAETDEVVETFLPERLDESFDEGAGVLPFYSAIS